MPSMNVDVPCEKIQAVGGCDMLAWELGFNGGERNPILPYILNITSHISSVLPVGFFFLINKLSHGCNANTHFCLLVPFTKAKMGSCDL
jgi:hypothetical protein